MADYSFDSTYDYTVNESFVGTAGSDRLTAKFQCEGFSYAAEIRTTYSENINGSFTATYHNELQNGTADSVTISGIENVTIYAPDTYTFFDGTVYSLNKDDENQTGNGDDVIFAYGDRDQVRAGRGIDILDGGEAIDGLAKDFSDVSTAIVFNLLTNRFSGPGSITNFEYFLDLKTGSGNDRITTSDVLYAGQ